MKKDSVVESSSTLKLHHQLLKLHEPVEKEPCYCSSSLDHTLSLRTSSIYSSECFTFIMGIFSQWLANFLFTQKLDSVGSF